MGLGRDEDTLEGKFGKARGPSTRGLSTFPDISVTGSKHTKARSRAAWYNRARGAGKVKLAPERSPSGQRVVVKIRPVVHANVRNVGGAGGLMRHALYVEREGAGRDGDQVTVFDAEHDRADGAAFVERCENDRHHFRVILSPEHGEQLRDLKDFTRELVRRVEQDLGTGIDWIAAEHHDTGRPHVHLLMRGRRDDGRDLVIPRDYVSHSFRHRAEEIVTRELGPRLGHSLGHELEGSGDRAATLTRFTHLDETLIDHARANEFSVAALPQDRHTRALLVRRLNRLEEMGLAARQGSDRWRVDGELEDKLTRLGDARDRERAIARLLAKEDRGLEPERMRELEQAMKDHRVTGRLVGFEQMGDDVRGPYVVGIEALDGRFWTARVGRMEDLRGLNGVDRGAIVNMERASPDLRSADRTIVDVAGEDREYSAEHHRQAIPSDREQYIQMHVRRLEALRMERIVERDGNGVFRLPVDYEKRVIEREARGGRESARVTLLDPAPLEKQVSHQGPTWIDGGFDGRVDWSQVAQSGFGMEARNATVQREATLKEFGLAREESGTLKLDAGWQRTLRELERDNLRERIERETGRVPHFARDGERVRGVFVSRVHTQGRSYAVIVSDRAATLAPWRPEMDRAMSQSISGQVNGRQFDFKYGRGVEKDIAKGLGLGR